MINFRNILRSIALVVMIQMCAQLYRRSLVVLGQGNFLQQKSRICQRWLRCTPAQVLGCTHHYILLNTRLIICILSVYVFVLPLVFVTYSLAACMYHFSMLNAGLTFAIVLVFVTILHPQTTLLLIICLNFRGDDCIVPEISRCMHHSILLKTRKGGQCTCWFSVLQSKWDFWCIQQHLDVSECALKEGMKGIIEGEVIRRINKLAKCIAHI